MGLNYVHLYGPRLAKNMEVKLADARCRVLQIVLKEIAFDIMRFGQLRPYGRASLEGYESDLFKVLVSMLETYVRVKLDRQGKTVVDGEEEEECYLSHVDIERHGWRIDVRRCTDYLKSSFLILWDSVDSLPRFRFDDSNFFGSRPVPTWKWFSRSEAPPGQAKTGVMAHPGTTRLDRDAISVAGTGDSEDKLGEGDPGVLHEKCGLAPPHGV